MKKFNLFVGLILLVSLTSCWKGDTMQKQNKTIFSFFGAPGSGKGTLAEQVVDQLDYLTLSTGDLLRENIAKGTEIGKKVKDYLDKGKLVPDQLITDMVKDWLISKKDSNKNIILDGFPRTKEQAESLLKIIKTDLPEHNLRIIALDMPEKEIVSRLSGRRVCPNKECKAVYNIAMPGIEDGGKCPKCGTRIVTREDDKPEVIKDRFTVYKKHETDLIDFYKSAGQKIETINISELNKEKVFDKFKAIA